MNETELEQAIWKYLNESPAFLKSNNGRYRTARELVEAVVIKHAMKRTRNNKVRAAQLAGMNRNTILRRIRAYGLNIPCFYARGPHAS
jgi:DNA-binding protein Fis